ncbi:MAG TPA: CbiQ family ECF transporter T component [Gemmataceae bacterium]|nr:CbiQ family ECF transporter T component [Gemmataceae bacterium]
MTLQFTPPPRTTSPLTRLDPRWKLAAIVLAAIAVAALHRWPAAVAALCGAVVLALLGRLPWRWWVARLAPAVLFVAVFAVPPLFFGRNPLTAVILLCKAAALVTLALVLLAAAPLDATLKAAHALRAPGVLVQLTLMSYRYVFLLADELGRLRIALRLRGYRNRANLHSYRTIGAVSGALLVRGWERADRVGQAMRCRGFDGRFRSLSDFRTSAADVLAFVVIVAAAAGVCAVDWIL